MSEASEPNRSASARPSRVMPPGELERMIRSDDAQDALPKELRDRIAADLRHQRRHLERLTCSSAWLSNCWEGGDTFPPPAQTSPMLACQCERCSRTGRLWPPHYAAPGQGAGGAAGFLSYECYLESLSDEAAAQLPSSPSGLALRAIREGRIKLRRQRTHTASRRFVS